MDIGLGQRLIDAALIRAECTTALQHALERQLSFRRHKMWSKLNIHRVLFWFDDFAPRPGLTVLDPAIVLTARKQLTSRRVELN